MKTKLQKHMDELEEMTSGNSKDAVTFAGRGLDLLKSLVGLSKKAGEADEEDADEDPEDPADTNEDQDEAENAGKMKKSTRNGGDLEEADEDPEDPAQAGDDAKGGSIITNKGKKISKEGSPAVKKSYEFDEDHFEKSFESTYEDAIDASDALADLAKSVRVIGNAHNSNASLIKSVADGQVILAKSLTELFKSVASLAADMEAIKKQPVSTPATGFVVMQKKAGDQSKEISLRKSDIADAITDALNSGHAEASALLKKLGVLHNTAELKDFVDNILPDDIRETL